jgi:hypothetical protein
LRAEIQVDERIAETARLFALNRAQLRNSRIAMFFLIAYAISWTAWITLFARHLPPFAWPGRWLYLAAVLAPHGAALVSTAVEGGRAELGAFYRRITRQVPFRWAIVAICVPPLYTWCVMRCPLASICPTIRFFTAHREL